MQPDHDKLNLLLSFFQLNLLSRLLGYCRHLGGKHEVPCIKSTKQVQRRRERQNCQNMYWLWKAAPRDSGSRAMAGIHREQAPQTSFPNWESPFLPTQSEGMENKTARLSLTACPRRWAMVIRAFSGKTRVTKPSSLSNPVRNAEKPETFMVTTACPNHSELCGKEQSGCLQNHKHLQQNQTTISIVC